MSAATLLEDGTSHGVSVNGGRLVCLTPCGFGTFPGEYEFTVGSPGYQDTVVARRGEYGRVEGSCPSQHRDGVEIALRLSPSPD